MTINTLAEYQEKLNQTLCQQKEAFDVICTQNGCDLNFAREMNYVYSTVLSGVNNENSFPFTPLESIAEAFLNIARSGLSLNPQGQLCFLTVRYDNTIGLPVTVLDFGYRGLIKLAMRTKKVRCITPDVFYSKDDFEYHGPQKPVKHVTKALSVNARGELAGGYCTSTLTDGTVLTTTMTPEEILTIEHACQAAGSAAWSSVFVDELRRKTLIRRHFKTLVQQLYVDAQSPDAQALKTASDNLDNSFQGAL